MESQVAEQKSGTNCLDCERYKKLGDICVIEHGKKFLWEFCKDFEQEVSLPDYKQLMSTVKKDLAAERKKIREKKKREKSLQRKLLKKTPLPSGTCQAVEKRTVSQKPATVVSKVKAAESEPGKSGTQRKSPGKKPKEKTKEPRPMRIVEIRKNYGKVPILVSRVSNDQGHRDSRNVVKRISKNKSKVAMVSQAKTPRTASSAKATA